jgi:uncharacterized protein (DUF983 family)
MSSRATFGILERPIEPPLFGRCPKCGRWFVFKPVLEEQSALSHTVSTYRCDRCGYEEKFAHRHPPHAI